MLWTVMPEEAILNGIDEKRDYQLKQYRGKDIIVESKKDSKGIIVQLLSTDPADYLDTAYSPGNEINQD